MMSPLGLTFTISASIAAPGVSGWRITAWIVAAGVICFDFKSVLTLDQVGTVDTLWRTIAILWTAAIVSTAKYSRRNGVNRIFRPGYTTRYDHVIRNLHSTHAN